MTKQIGLPDISGSCGGKTGRRASFNPFPAEPAHLTLSTRLELTISRVSPLVWPNIDLSRRYGAYFAASSCVTDIDISISRSDSWSLHFDIA